MASLTIEFNSVSIPTSDSVTLTAAEDVNGDGIYENTTSVALTDGQTSYSLNGFDTSSGNSVRIWINFESTVTSTAEITEPVTVGFIEETAVASQTSINTVELGQSSSSASPFYEIQVIESETIRESTSNTSTFSEIQIGDITDRTAHGDTVGNVEIDPLLVNAEATIGIGETTVTALGSQQLSTVTKQDAIGTADVFAVTTPPEFSLSTFESVVDTVTTSVAEDTTAVGSAITGAFETSTDANADVSIVSSIPISPTLSIVTVVDKTGVGIEGAFADSLAASVGAQTAIKVAKTRANADQLESTVAATTIVNAVSAIFDAIKGDALGTSSSDSQGTTASLSTIQIGESSSDTVSDVDNTTLTTSGLLVDGFAETVADIMATAAESLVSIGVFNTAVEATAFLSSAVTQDQRGAPFTTTAAPATRTGMDIIDRLSVPHAQANPLSTRAFVSTVNVSGDGTAAAVSQQPPTTISALPLSSLIRLYYTAQRGATDAVVVTEQRTNVINGENNVRVIQ